MMSYVSLPISSTIAPPVIIFSSATTYGYVEISVANYRNFIMKTSSIQCIRMKI